MEQREAKRIQATELVQVGEQGAPIAGKKYRD
jgi:hypothetical protein